MSELRIDNDQKWTAAMDTLIGICAQQFAVSQLLMKDYCERNNVSKEEVQKDFNTDVILFTGVLRDLLYEDYGETPIIEVAKV